MDKIVELQTERSLEDNFAFIGSEYFDKVNKSNLAIYGTIDKITNKLVLVARPEVVDALMGVVNQINQQWDNSNGIQ